MFEVRQSRDRQGGVGMINSGMCSKCFDALFEGTEDE